MLYRSWVRNEEFGGEVFDGRPVIGIASTWSELAPCNAHLDRVAEAVKREATEDQARSTGYKKAKRQVAKLHRQVARQRSDDARKWAKGVVAAFDQIAAEDFRPKFLARSTMAKRPAEAAIGATKAALVHMADKHGRDLCLVDPAYTTMDCSICGARAKHRLDLSERTYACEACGVVLPRDKNEAAVMVERAGFVPLVPRAQDQGRSLRSWLHEPGIPRLQPWGGCNA